MLNSLHRSVAILLVATFLIDPPAVHALAVLRPASADAHCPIASAAFKEEAIVAALRLPRSIFPQLGIREIKDILALKVRFILHVPRNIASGTMDERDHELLDAQLAEQYKLY